MCVTMTGAARQGWPACRYWHGADMASHATIGTRQGRMAGIHATTRTGHALRDGAADSIAEFSPPRPKQQHTSE